MACPARRRVRRNLEPAVERDPTIGVPKGLHVDRIPGSVEEAREMVAYNERIVATSGSRQRTYRAARMLVNLRPHLERLEREEADRLARIVTSGPPASTFEGTLQRFRDEAQLARETDPTMEVAWNGTMGRQGKQLTGEGYGASSLSGGVIKGLG